jgi:GGDEF domain-containing protein
MNTEQAAALHPITRLPGSDMIAELVDRKVADGDIFAVSWLDVDHFGAVNDSGGFTTGDDLIRELGRALTDAATMAVSENVAVAHLGGDDFLVVCDLEDVVPFGSAVLDEPWEVGGREVVLSLVSLVCTPGAVAGHRDVSRMLARLRIQAKSMPGTTWLFGRADSERVDVLRHGMDVERDIKDAEPLPGGNQSLRGSLEWIPSERRRTG